MAKDSNIPWCNDTINPWIGCCKIQAGCKNCYIMRSFPGRKAKARDIPIMGTPDKSRRIKTKHWDKKLASFERLAIREQRRRIVFAGSLCDVFEDNPQVGEWRDDYLDLLANYSYNKRLVHLLLTKRPENIARMVPVDWMLDWPENIAIGTSAATQKDLDRNLPHLLKIPAWSHFVSLEPLIEPVRIAKYLSPVIYDHPLRWVIVGGESGTPRREFRADWARIVFEKCRIFNVAFFMKALGGPASNKREDMSDFPHDLRVRLYPPEFEVEGVNLTKGIFEEI